jgi:predicted signal transduction protein with EAL and GGDEF domain
MPRRKWLIAIVALACASCAGGLKTSLERVLEARRLAADLLVQFAKVVDGGNRAVMADTDDASIAFARETEETTQLVQQDVEALKSVLVTLGYSSEARLLEEFQQRFSEYRALDTHILGLAVENTNLKAQRLSFGSAQQAADAFSEALDAIARSVPAQAPWRVAALASTAVAAVREIQVLQAPHIAESEDAAMTRLEERMATSEATARDALQELAGLVPSESRPRLTAATAALDRFMSANAEIVRLSRRNSNVRSLALSLGQKRTLTARCEETLRRLEDALARRSIGGGTR